MTKSKKALKINPRTIKCKNCGIEFAGNYCFTCGQKATVAPITFKEIFHEGWHTMTHTDKGYLQLFWEMLLRPGQTIKNYLSGKRKKYFSPFTYFIVTTSLLILLSHWVFHKEDEIYHINNEIGNYISQKLNYVLLCSLPVTSLLFCALFKHSVKALAESFVVMIFAYGTMNFFLLIANIFFYVFISLHYEYYGYTIVIGYLFLFYILYSFMRPLKVWGFIKLLLLTVLFYFIVEQIGKGLLLYLYGVPLEQLLRF